MATILSPGRYVTYLDQDLDENKAEVTDSAGATIFGVVASNAGTASQLAYLHIWNKDADDVTVGTTAPDWVFNIPSTQVGGLLQINFYPGGLFLDTGFTVAAKTVGTTAGTTGPTGAVTCTIFYRV